MKDNPNLLKPPTAPQLLRIEGVPRELSQVQANVDKATIKARRYPQIQGETRRRVSVPATGNDFIVFHSMGKRHTGWQIVRETGAKTSFYEKSADKKKITFTSSGNAGTVDLLIW